MFILTRTDHNVIGLNERLIHHGNSIGHFPLDSTREKVDNFVRSLNELNREDIEKINPLLVDHSPNNIYSMYSYEEIGEVDIKDIVFNDKLLDKFNRSSYN